MQRISDDEARLHYSPAEAQKKADRRAAKEAEQAEAGVPEAPEHLTADEKAVFTKAAEMLAARGTVTVGDGQLLALYAQAVVALRAKKERMEEEGGRVIIVSKFDRMQREIRIHAVNPRFKVVRDLENQIVLMLRELGMTPLRRDRVGKTRGSKRLTIDSLLDFSRRPS
jgi:P27 family predicted phage terminase small subunit